MKLFESGYCWISFFSRLLLGLLFLMIGWHKLFVIGPEVFATEQFVNAYQNYWIPGWLLYGMGYIIPYIELVGGAFLLLGLRVMTVLIILGFLLVIVTYGHLLKEPFFDITTHILPRFILLIIILAIPRTEDRWSIDAWLEYRRGKGND